VCVRACVLLDSFGVCVRVGAVFVSHFLLARLLALPSCMPQQYEYVMDARFRGASDADDPITCRVASAIIEPFFSVSPAEMRKLNKSDRTRSDALVGEGGRALRRCTLQLHCYELTLEHSPEDFFAAAESSAMTATTSLNGSKPILCLQRRRG